MAKFTPETARMMRARRTPESNAQTIALMLKGKRREAIAREERYWIDLSIRRRILRSKQELAHRAMVQALREAAAVLASLPQ